MRHTFYLLEPGMILGVSLILFIVACFLANSIVRGRRIPRCLQCGAIKVRPSPPLGFLDAAGAFLMIQAYRCEGCRARFHAVTLSNRSIS